MGLVEGVAPTEVEVGLPDGRRVRFAVEAEQANRCVVVKDAGDDPDCTDGARMTATVRWLDAGIRPGPGAVPGGLQVAGGESVLLAGPGVGVVTAPGLGLDIGSASITAVPRRMILAAVAEVCDRAVEVTLEVPGGEAMAGHTTNARLGIVGGISILGTTGVVRPFSTAAYRASVVQQVDVAAAQGHKLMVLATGSRSEQAARAMLPDIAPVCLVEVGDFTGICLRRVAAQQMTDVVWVGMVGKIAKLAAGVMMTHFHRSKVDTSLLEQTALATGSPPEVVRAAQATETARHFFEVCVSAGALAPLEMLCAMARDRCAGFVDGRLAIEVAMVDFDGRQVVARA